MTRNQPQLFPVPSASHPLPPKKNKYAMFPSGFSLLQQGAMAEEGRVRRKALGERLKAKRRAKEVELHRRGAGEGERCDQDADMTRLEELETEVCFAKITPSIQWSKTDCCCCRPLLVVYRG